MLRSLQSKSAQKAAITLVDAALAAGSYDNVGVVVVDLRSFWTRQVDTEGKKINFNMAQKVCLPSCDLVYVSCVNVQRDRLRDVYEV